MHTFVFDAEPFEILENPENPEYPNDDNTECFVPMKFSSPRISNPFLIIVPAGDQCRQPVPNSRRHVAILRRFPGIMTPVSTQISRKMECTIGLHIKSIDAVATN